MNEKYRIQVRILLTEETAPRIVKDVVAEAIFEPLSDFKAHALNDHICGVTAGAWRAARDKLRKELEK